MLGPQAFNKLDSGQINYILKVDKDFYSAEDTKDKKAQTFTRTDAILKYRDLNSTDVSNLLLSIDNKNGLEKMLDTIGKDKLKTLEAEHVSYLIRYYLNNKFGPFGRRFISELNG